jgi:hypothetical protein
MKFSLKSGEWSRKTRNDGKRAEVRGQRSEVRWQRDGGHNEPVRSCRTCYWVEYRLFLHTFPDEASAIFLITSLNFFSLGSSTRSD